MNRPDVEKYEAMVAAARGDIVGYLVTGRGPAARLVKEGYTAIPELCAYVRELESILRDWRACCSQACGGSDECVRRAEEAGK